MGENGREARRRRIISGSQDRLALITGRINSDSSQSLDLDHDHPTSSHQPSFSQNEEDNSAYIMPARDHAPAKFSQDGELNSQRRDQSFVREPESAAQKVILTALDLVLRVAQQIPISNVTSQQVTAVIAITEHDRFLCALTMSILVVLSYSGFPIVGSRVFRWLILFRPLFLVLITNITLIVRRLLPDNQKNLVRGDKANNIGSLLGDGYVWAEEAGKALELGLMLQNIVGALFMDCSVYATIVVFGLSLFG